MLESHREMNADRDGSSREMHPSNLTIIISINQSVVYVDIIIGLWTAGQRFKDKIMMGVMDRK